MHGGDYTKAARRAVDDAIRHASLLFFRALGIRDLDKVYVDVVVGIPKPEAVDGEEVLKALPFGQRTFKAVPGGLEIQPYEDRPDPIIMANAAITVSLEV